MNKQLIIFLILLISFVNFFVTPVFAQKEEQFLNSTEKIGKITEIPDGSKFAQNQIIVKFKNNRNSAQSWEKIGSKYKMKETKKIFESGQNLKGPGFQTRSENLDNIYLIKFEENLDIKKALGEFSRLDSVEFAQPNYIRQTQMIPNDPYFSAQNGWRQGYDDMWALKRIKAENAWDESQGDEVTVAVVDSGIDYSHEDLAANIFINPGEFGQGKESNNLDDDQNGLIDDFRGFDFTTCEQFDLFGNCAKPKNPDNDASDGLGHGTHVAGIISAVGNNNTGIIGVAPKSKILAIKGLNDYGQGLDSDLAEAIFYAQKQKAQIINASWGGRGVSPVIDWAIDEVYKNNILLVAAAGNYNDNTEWFHPAGNEKVLTVASTDFNDKKSDFSNYGSEVDISAPGGESGFYKENFTCDYPKANILSLRAAGTDMIYCPQKGQTFYPKPGDQNSKYYRSLGTSMAAPYVSGVATLVKSKFPNDKPEQISARIKASADPLPQPVFDRLGNQLGTGRLNAYNALTIAPTPYFEISNIKLEERTGDGDQIPEAGETIKLSLDLKNIWQDSSFVQVNLTSQSNRVQMLVDSTSFDPIKTNQIKSSLNPIVFRISDASLRNEEEIEAELEISNQEKIQKTKILIPLGTRLIASKDHKIDTSSFNGVSISGNYLVWHGYKNNNWDIYFYDLVKNEQRQITQNPANQAYPAISGTKIVWQDNRTGNWDIFSYDISTGQESQITFDLEDQTHPAISGDIVVWQEYIWGQNRPNWDIFYKNLALGQKERITTDDYDQEDPAIFGEDIVWDGYTQGASSGTRQISHYNLAERQIEKVIKTRASDAYFPQIDQGRVVFMDFWGGGTQNPDIYLFDLNTNQEKRLSYSLGYEMLPKISGSRIVWQDFRSTNFDVYLYDLEKEREIILATSNSFQTNPAIFQDNVAWLKKGSEIYFSEIPAQIDFYNKKLESRFELISFPEIPDPNPKIAFSPIAVSGNLSRYDASSLSYQTYFDFAPSAFGNLGISDGYWFGAPESGTISISDEESVQKEINLQKAGWHLIAGPSKTTPTMNVKVKDANDQVFSWNDAGHLIQKNLYGYNAFRGKYYTVGSEPYIFGQNHLSPWQGYWVYTFADNVRVIMP